MSETNPYLDRQGRPRVVVTGIGVKTPAGLDVDTFWTRIRSGVPCADFIKGWDTTDIAVKIGCEVRDFDAVEYFGPKEVRRVDPFTQVGFAAAADALKDAGDPGVDPARCAVVTGTGVGGIWTYEEQFNVTHEKGHDRVSPFFVPMMMANACAGTISMNFGYTGPNINITTACAAGTHAVGEGFRLIRDGSSDVVAVCGTEHGMTPMTVSAFARMGALSPNPDPALASRPFDRARDGFVMGEGASAMILERMDKAVARGAKIYGEIVGYGRNGDAYHITAPSPGGVGAAACMQLALDDAGLNPADIGHINAHGTSTPLNDAGEAEAIMKVFSDAAPPVTSTKGVTGHLIAAAGATEAVISLLAVRDGVIPPTANFEQGDEGMTLDIVHGSERAFTSAPVLSNSFGFGGHNASIIVAPFTQPA